MDDISTSTLFIILGFLVLFSAYFSGSETGIMSINRIRLRHLAKEDHRAAKRVSKLLSRPDRLIGLILIGNNLVNIAAAQVATIIGIRLYGDLGIAIGSANILQYITGAHFDMTHDSVLFTAIGKLVKPGPSTNPDENAQILMT